jgi:protein involved in polysaccharide export with SLBB domain
MTKKIVFLLFMAGTLCAAQSTLVTPGADVQQNPEDETTYPTGQAAQQGNTRRGQGSTIPDLSHGETELPAPSNVTPGMQPRLIPRTSRIVGPLKTKSEFQQYAEDSTGRQLPVYGRQLFDQVPTTFAPVENVPVPADYVLGPDDQLLIRAWGKIELNTRVTIDRNGQINLPRVGTLTVAGLHYSQVESFIKSAIGGLFKDFELNVTIGRLRTIQVYVLGNARQPGAYTVSALSTLVDSLFSSGGPSATGTMRDIQLRREGKTISDFDLYDLISTGDKSKDVRLLPGDVIFIPAIGPQVAMSGDVNMPGIFELRGATTTGTAIAFAGGMTSLASVERAVVERIEDHSSRTVIEFALDAQGQTRELKDGDILRIFPLSPKFANAITLRGNVAVPGLYPWKTGMRVSDLIPSRGMLITRDYWNKENHLVQPIAMRPFSTNQPRYYPPTNQQTNRPYNQQTGSQPGMQTDMQTGMPPDMQTGMPLDMQTGLPTGVATDQVYDQYGNPIGVMIGGRGIENPQGQYANQPGEQNVDAQGNPIRPNERGRVPGAVSPAIAAVGRNSAEINWEYALIERLDEHDLSTHLIPFRLASAIDDHNSADNQTLEPGDVVTIFSRADLELPTEKHASFVRVGGEVNAPGVYRVNPGATLRDVVKLAGGLTKHSYLYASIFTRVSTRMAQEQELQQSTEQMQRELAAKFANAVPQAGAQGVTQQQQLAIQQDALAKLTAIRPTGRVVLAMKPDAVNVSDIPNFPLEDGDALYVPPILSTVQVAGAVYNANAFRYEPGLQLGSYLNSAGGATREADSGRTFVIRADGTVISRQAHHSYSHVSFDHLRLLPGDAIVVPTKMRVTSRTAEVMQWTTLMSQMAITAASLSVIHP